MQQKEDIWPGIWKALESYGTVKLSGDQISFTVDEAKALDLALAHRIQTSSIFDENTRSAQKKGWDWSGDTDVSIYSFTAPSVEQALVAVIIMYARTRGCGTFERDRDELQEYSQMKWEKLWDISISGYETNVLKKAKGGPEQVFVLVSDGNDKLTLARQGTTYYLIDFATS